MNITKDWSMEIVRVRNGFVVFMPTEDPDLLDNEFVVEIPDNEVKEITAYRDLLFIIMDHFNMMTRDKYITLSIEDKEE